MHADTASAHPNTSPRRSSRVLSIIASIVVALVLAECLSSLVHRGAFPYLNIFVADDALGVRLRPNAETRVRSRSGRVTTIRTNTLGFRGAEWPSPEATGDRARVLLLGDSQMFGYNVEESDAVAARLEARGGLTVLNAAVPTWGPPDYVTALRAIAPEQRPRFVLFVANAANDWFEPVPNRRRTTARDGWATRAGTPAPRSFPFRDYLMGRSHLVLGVRQVASYVGDAQLSSSSSALRLKTDLSMLRKGAPPFRSTIGPQLEAAAATCAELGCEVVAVALPCDVQVSAAEWPKYRAAPVDLGSTEALLEDFVADAGMLGLRAINLLPVLRAAEPGAFLDDDYHMSAKGHRAIADAISLVLRHEEAHLGAAP